MLVSAMIQKQGLAFMAVTLAYVINLHCFMCSVIFVNLVGIICSAFAHAKVTLMMYAGILLGHPHDLLFFGVPYLVSISRQIVLINYVYNLLEVTELFLVFVMIIKIQKLTNFVLEANIIDLDRNKYNVQFKIVLFKTYAS